MSRALFATLFISYIACAQPQAHTETTPESTGTKVDIEGLFGDWLDVQDSGRTYVHEHWERGKDGTPIGLGCVLSGKDTVFIERLALVRLNDTLHYAVSIGSQGGEATLFKLIHDRDSLVFANPAHDMPQRIVYVPQGPDAWHASVSGIHQGRIVTDHYHFERTRKGEVETVN